MISKNEFQFKVDTSDLEVGMFLPINQGNKTIQVIGIDSILVGDSYRKSYKIDQSDLIGPNQWIEGIGSTKDLLSPFSREFEWAFYTLCFTDSITYYINSPDGKDSCHYYLPVSLDEQINNSISVYPNPSSLKIVLNLPQDILPITIYIVNSIGQLVGKEYYKFSNNVIDISQYETGIYYIMCKFEDKRIFGKFIKE